MRIVFIGPPGVGKGTQGKRLVEYLGITHLSTGEMLRAEMQNGTEIGKLSASFMRTGALVPDSLILKLVAERLQQSDCDNGVLFDGFPRTLAQAEALDSMLSAGDKPLTAALQLVVDREEIVRRLAARGREDDKPEIIRQRLVQYEAQTAPLAQYYHSQGKLYEIDGQGSQDDVFDRIRALVDRLR